MRNVVLSEKRSAPRGESGSSLALVLMATFLLSGLGMLFLRYGSQQKDARMLANNVILVAEAKDYFVTKLPCGADKATLVARLNEKSFQKEILKRTFNMEVEVDSGNAHVALRYRHKPSDVWRPLLTVEALSCQALGNDEAEPLPNGHWNDAVCNAKIQRNELDAANLYRCCRGVSKVDLGWNKANMTCTKGRWALMGGGSCYQTFKDYPAGKVPGGVIHHAAPNLMKGVYLGNIVDCDVNHIDANPSKKAPSPGERTDIEADNIFVCCPDIGAK